MSVKISSEAKLTVSVMEAAKLLGIGRNAAYEAIRRRELPAVKIGGRILVPVTALEKMLADCTSVSQRDTTLPHVDTGWA